MNKNIEKKNLALYQYRRPKLKITSQKVVK